MPEFSWRDKRTITAIFLVAAIIITILHIAAILEGTDDRGISERTGIPQELRYERQPNGTELPGPLQTGKGGGFHREERAVISRPEL